MRFLRKIKKILSTLEQFKNNTCLTYRNDETKRSSVLKKTSKGEVVKPEYMILERGIEGVAFMELMENRRACLKFVTSGPLHCLVGNFLSVAVVRKVCFL